MEKNKRKFQIDREPNGKYAIYQKTSTGTFSCYDDLWNRLDYFSTREEAQNYLHDYSYSIL